MLERDPVNEQPKRLIVEVGSGGVSALSLGTRGKKDDEVFVSLDLDPNQVRDEKDAHVIVADGTNLPFADKCVDELIYTNVFGDHHLQKPEKMLTEAQRVLKPEGFVFITETYTPKKMAQTLGVSLRRSELEKQGHMKWELIKVDDSGLLDSSGFIIDSWSGAPDDVAQFERYFGKPWGGIAIKLKKKS
ncbi:MAG: class I SAM-dependent methyltransferase [Candidatus Magasanikbacteria bacterium]|nr:class I SAM-dependent methyltransferase [Candidatus Magasanikbacteria bacterium]